MDWLDEKIEIFIDRVTHLSIRKAICFYIIISIIPVVFLTYITQSTTQRWESMIWSNNKQRVIEIDSETEIYYYVNDYSKLSDKERVIVDIIDFIHTWCVFWYAILGMVGTSYLFYKNKLREPLKLLEEGAYKIGQNELDFEINYPYKDEMGKLCQSFETMRRQLETNMKVMWDSAQEQKNLNAAFAHDLRTPLTVLKGYTDLLNQYVPQGKIKEEKLFYTLHMMSEHVKRLECYCNNMKEINSLDQYPVNQMYINPLVLWNKLKEIANRVDNPNEIPIHLSNFTRELSSIWLDELIILEVYENLLANALRYARSEIVVEVELLQDEKMFALIVEDDGEGFGKEEIQKVVDPFYKGKGDKTSTNLGLGLYICKKLCEKHRGTMVVSNRRQKGAKVRASFFVERL